MIYVAIGAFFGAVSRYAVSHKIDSKLKTNFPYGTLCVNVIGSFILGYIIGIKMTDSITLLLGTGFMGAFTTFSTFKIESFKYLLDKKWILFTIYILSTYGFGILFAFLGYRLFS